MNHGFKPQAAKWTPAGLFLAFNDTLDCERVFLSYNRRDRTSAIVPHNHGFFFVLVGDHRAGLAATGGDPSLLAKYFADNISLASDTSEHLYAVGLTAHDPLNVQKRAREVFSEADLDLIKAAQVALAVSQDTEE